MRISDWSSDVCSSDLGAQPLVQIIAEGSQPNTANYVTNYAQGVVQTWRGGLDGETPRAAVTMEPRYWFNAELESRRALVPGAKIGRASCRERVCQYGKISVAAVSLKKKQKNKRRKKIA